MALSIPGGPEERLKDKARKVFFSEEKKQKTFIFQWLANVTPWLGSCRRRRDKSLLLRAGRASAFSSMPYQWGIADSARCVATPQPPCYSPRAP
jgi:hypothetical protein